MSTLHNELSAIQRVSPTLGLLLATTLTEDASFDPTLLMRLSSASKEFNLDINNEQVWGFILRLYYLGANHDYTNDQVGAWMNVLLAQWRLFIQRHSHLARGNERWRLMKRLVEYLNEDFRAESFKPVTSPNEAKYILKKNFRFQVLENHPLPSVSSQSMSGNTSLMDATLLPYKLQNDRWKASSNNNEKLGMTYCSTDGASSRLLYFIPPTTHRGHSMYSLDRDGIYAPAINPNDWTLSSMSMLDDDDTETPKAAPYAQLFPWRKEKLACVAIESGLLCISIHTSEISDHKDLFVRAWNVDTGAAAMFPLDNKNRRAHEALRFVRSIHATRKTILIVGLDCMLTMRWNANTLTSDGDSIVITPLLATYSNAFSDASQQQLTALNHRARTWIKARRDSIQALFVIPTTSPQYFFMLKEALAIDVALDAIHGSRFLLRISFNKSPKRDFMHAIIIDEADSKWRNFVDKTFLHSSGAMFSGRVAEDGTLDSSWKQPIHIAVDSNPNVVPDEQLTENDALFVGTDIRRGYTICVPLLSSVYVDAFQMAYLPVNVDGLKRRQKIFIEHFFWYQVSSAQKFNNMLKKFYRTADMEENLDRGGFNIKEEPIVDWTILARPSQIRAHINVDWEFKGFVVGTLDQHGNAVINLHYPENSLDAHMKFREPASGDRYEKLRFGVGGGMFLVMRIRIRIHHGLTNDPIEIYPIALNRYDADLVVNATYPTDPSRPYPTVYQLKYGGKMLSSRGLPISEINADQ